MKRRELKKYLYDISQACGLLASFTEGKGLLEYRADPMLRSAVERQFEIIGEALSQASRDFPELPNKISDADRIIAFRNRLIHGYATVSDEVVWGIVEGSLQQLRREVGQLLDEP